MIEIVLASSNAGKMAEIESLLAETPFKLIPQSEFDIEDADEIGTTFVENAIIKARHASKISGLPALADDSGLCVDHLGGAPGVLSSRYAGPNATDEERIAKVLKNLGDDKATDRSASFHCVIALIEHADDPAPLICHGIWPGEILHEARGHNGFGYDPIFYVPTHNCSAAELDPDEKNQMSHRGQALHELNEILHELL